jgi:hypothetical protein
MGVAFQFLCRFVQLSKKGLGKEEVRVGKSSAIKECLHLIPYRLDVTVNRGAKRSHPFVMVGDGTAPASGTRRVH